MTQEETLFAKVAEEIQKQFDSIGDSRVKDAVQASFNTYKQAYEEKSEAQLNELKNGIDKLNKQFGELDEDQTKELATQLNKIEEQLTKFEGSLRTIGEKVSKGGQAVSGEGIKGEFSKQIGDYLLNKLPHEDGKVLFDGMENMGFDAIGNVDDAKKAGGKVASLSTRAMFAAIDHTNANSTAGQAVARDMSTMGFKDIPPILNDHVADIFTTPKMERKAFMTLRIFHTFVDGSDIKVEGTGTFAKSSVMLKSQDFKVFTYGTQYRISMEEFEDVPEITAELNKVIPDLLMNDVDTKVLTDGGDNSTAPWGAFSVNGTYPNVTKFNPYLYAGSNLKADVADVIGKMKLQARSQNFRVNAVLAHDNFYDNYEGLRDGNSNSLFDRRVQFTPTGEISGMSGLATRRTRVMNQNAVLVGSTPSQILGIRETVMMQAGLATGDFETHNMSVKFWGRFAYGVKDALANIYTPDFNVDIDVLKMNAATALAYTQGVAAGTTGFDQANVTISLLKTAECTDLVDANETAYQVAIEAAASIADLAALQAIIAAVNAA